MDRIPILIDDTEGLYNWSNYYEHHPTQSFYKASEPLSPHPYYKNFIPDNIEYLLDAGSGDGVMSAGAADKVKYIFCVDYSLFALRRLLKRGLSNMIPVVASVTKLPFRDSFFDVILNTFVIEHLNGEEAKNMLFEFSRCLKEDGLLIISTDTKFYYRYLRSVYESIKQRKIVKDDPTHINLMNPNKLRILLNKCGFKIIFEDIWKIGWRYKIGKVFHNYFPIPLKWKENFFSRGFMFICKKDLM
jgi:SAM-dependent methyltransferase